MDIQGVGASPAAVLSFVNTFKTRKIDTLLDAQKSMDMVASPLGGFSQPPSREPSRPESVFPATNMARQFVNTLLPLAKSAALRLQVDPRLLLAQAALETGWGRAVIHGTAGSSHNYFNIKASGRGPAMESNTTEYAANAPVKTRAAFRQYADAAASFEDYANLLLHAKRYQGVHRHARNPEMWLQSLQQAGFATDPHYAQKVLAVYRGL